MAPDGRLIFLGVPDDDPGLYTSTDGRNDRADEQGLASTTIEDVDPEKLRRNLPLLSSSNPTCPISDSVT